MHTKAVKVPKKQARLASYNIMTNNRMKLPNVTLYGGLYWIPKE